MGNSKQNQSNQNQSFIDAVISNANANQQVLSSQLAEVARDAKAEREDYFGRAMDNLSQTAYNLNATVNQGVVDTKNEIHSAKNEIITEVRNNSCRPKALGFIDWITIFIVTILGGVGGWFFSKCMISHQFAAWVDRTDTVEYIRDAAGNITDITNTTAATTVWPTVILTIVLFAIVGFTVTYAICDSIREKESD